MLNLRGVHVFEKIANTGQFRLKETHPAVRLTYEDNVLYIQDGQVYDAAGRLVKKPPEWFMGELSKMTPQALREVGWKDAK